MTHIYLMEYADYNGFPIGVFASLEGAKASRPDIKWKHFPAKGYPGGGHTDENWQAVRGEFESGYTITRWEVQA